MALYSKQEFAKKCGLETKNLSVYIGRKKVFLTGELIDSTNEFNAAFLEKRKRHSESTDNSNEIVTISQEKKTNNNIKEPPAQFSLPLSTDDEAYSSAERKLKQLDGQKRLVEIEKLEFDLAKKRGEVIPTELISPLFLQHNQSIITEFKNAADEVLRAFSKKKELSVNESAEMKGELVSIINQAMKRAIDQSLKSIDNIIEEFSNKKGVGERTS